MHQHVHNMDPNDPQVALGRRLSASLLQAPQLSTPTAEEPEVSNLASPKPDAIPGIPHDVASRLSSLADFRISFALTDVASILKYVLCELNMTKAKLGDVTMQLEAAERRTQASQDTETLLSSMVQQQQEQITELKAALKETRQQLKLALSGSLDDEDDIYDPSEPDVNNDISRTAADSTSLPVEESESASYEYGEDSTGEAIKSKLKSSPSSSQLLPRSHRTNSITNLIAKRKANRVAGYRTCVRAINRLARRLAQLDGAYQVSIGPNGKIFPKLNREELVEEDLATQREIERIELQEVKEREAEIIRSQQADSESSNLSSSSSSPLALEPAILPRPPSVTVTSAGAGTSFYTRQTPMDIMRRTVEESNEKLAELQKSLEDLKLQQTVLSTEVKQLSLRDLEVDGKVVELAKVVERDHNLLHAQLSNLAGSMVVMNGVRHTDPSQALRSGGTNRDSPQSDAQDRDSERNVKEDIARAALVSRLEGLEKEFAQLLTQLRSTRHEQDAVREELVNVRRAQSEAASRKTVEELSNQLMETTERLTRMDGQVNELSHKLDSEEAMLSGAPADLGTLRRAVAASSAKQRHMQDKLDALSALALTTRRQLAQIGTFESSPFFKSLNLRIHEFEIRFTELEDKLMILAHFLTRGAVNGAITGDVTSAGAAQASASISSDGSSSLTQRLFEQGRIAVQQASEGRALSLNENELQLKLLSRVTAPTIQKSLTEVAKDIETLSNLQTQLDDAKAILERLSSLAAIESKVQSLLDLDVPHRIQQIERKLNTEVSFLKAHLASKVDQSNIKILVSRIDSLLAAVNRTTFTLPTLVVANHEGVDLENLSPSGPLTVVPAATTSAGSLTATNAYSGPQTDLSGNAVQSTVRVGYSEPLRSTHKLLEATARAQAHGVSPSPNPAPNQNGPPSKSSRSNKPSGATTPQTTQLTPVNGQGPNGSQMLVQASGTVTHQVGVNLVTDSRENERLISLLMLKADTAAVNKVEELARALDRQQRDALIKVMSEIQLLKRAFARLTKGVSPTSLGILDVATGSATQNGGGGNGVQPRASPDEMSLGYDASGASSAPLGVALGYHSAETGSGSLGMGASARPSVNRADGSDAGTGTLTGPMERLVRQFEFLQVQVAGLESRLGKKADAETIEELQTSLLDRVIELVRANTSSMTNEGEGDSTTSLTVRSDKASPDAILRIHNILDDHEKRLTNHREWITRNTEDVAGLRAWAKAAHSLLTEREQERIAPGTVKQLEKQVNTIKRQVAHLVSDLDSPGTLPSILGTSSAAATLARPMTQHQLNRPPTQPIGRAATQRSVSSQVPLNLQSLQIPGSTSYVHPAHASSPLPLPGVLPPDPATADASPVDARCMSCERPVEKLPKFASTSPSIQGPSVGRHVSSVIPAGGFAGEALRQRYVNLLSEPRSARK